jgi:uncharacterized membrane protein (UPF0182 family)
VLQDLHEEQGAGYRAAGASETRDVSLETVLSTIVTVAVVVTAYLHWHADAAAQRPFNLPGLVIYCMLVGIVGLLVATLIEQRFEW